MAKSAFAKMRETQLNPLPVIIVSVVVVAALVFFMFIKPSMDNKRIADKWTSPEQAALRSPGGKPSDPGHDAFLANLRQKHSGGAAARAPRRRREETE